MKYCRFLLDNQIRYGAVDDRDGELWITGPAPIPEEDLACRLARAQSGQGESGFDPMPLSKADLLPPVTPSKIVCVGRNYRDHVRELGNEMPAEPLLFFKPPSSLLAPGGVVRLPGASSRVDFEGELALVIGRRVRNLKPGMNLRDIIRGCTLADDVSARDLQKKDGQWTRAKGFDTFCPVGPWVTSNFDPATATVITRLNGEEKQHGSTSDLIFDIATIIRYISQAMTLYPGDLIATGTPAGVGPMKADDTVSGEITGLGVLENPVAAE